MGIVDRRKQSIWYIIQLYYIIFFNLVHVLKEIERVIYQRPTESNEDTSARRV